jgi:hypothetical protein
MTKHGDDKLTPVRAIGVASARKAVDTVGLLDGAMHVWAVLYRATRTKILCMEGSHWNQGE